MFLYFLTVITIIGSITSKSIIINNISDCSITEDNILHYHGKHSFTKFENECLSWYDLQTIYTDIIIERKFVFDLSIKQAKNYCRNPNMNINGPWCFVQNEYIITMEQCNVCQSFLSNSTLPTNIDYIDEETNSDINKNSFQNLRNEVKRYGTYIREKFLEIIKRAKKKFKLIQSRISNYFNFNA